MLKVLKLIISLTILVCIFLPVSQCTLKSAPVISEETGETLVESKDVFKEIVLSEKLLERIEVISLEVLIWVAVFLLPLIFALTPILSGWKEAIKLTAQTITSMLLIYFVSFVVLGFAQPLPAGWLLVTCSALFFLITLNDWYQFKKHNKAKNLRSLRSLGRAKNARPF